MSTTNSVSQTNRRSARRQPPRGSVKIECRKGALGMGPNIAVAFLDLSDGGVRLITKEPLEPNAEAEVVLSGYGMRESIKRVGKVCWAVALENGSYCVGLHFQKRLPYRDVQFLARPSS